MLGLICPGGAGGEGTSDWPQFRGPHGQGVSEAKDPPVSWDRKKGVDWKVEVPGAGWSSPVVQDGRIVLTTGVEKRGKMTLGVMQYDAATGKKLWHRELFTPTEEETAAMHAKNSLASSTPVIRDGIVYAHFAHMGTAALRLEDGEVVWKHQERYPPVHGTGSSPALAGDLLVFNADAKEDPAVVALAARTGKPVWRTPREVEVKRTFSFSTPLVIDHGGRTLILSQGSGMIGAYAPADGKLVWRVRYGEGYSVVPRPLFVDGMIYACTGFGLPHLLAIKPDGARGDVTDSHVVWKVKRNVPKTPSVVAGHGLIYMVDDTGRVTGLDAMTGQVRWTEKLAGNFSASPVLAGHTLYACSEDGVCFVLKVSADGGKILEEIDMGDRIFASPAVLDGTVIIRSEGHLWRISGK
ncbi:MAG: PQQ-binding-like beta-propeller repeat protein [Akkermansiaceae bacterium]|nr:PQQ-binding-like beta-propeller repeat protein [Akkermansiaceae bacterium]NNM29845.1 PQQ-binding-like beta-propeller repeat protein [Akkermansiaceae bacterium]